jgi:hypothetical protein
MGRMESPASAETVELDELLVTVVVDNATDTLSSIPPGVPQLPEMFHLLSGTSRRRQLATRLGADQEERCSKLVAPFPLRCWRAIRTPDGSGGNMHPFAVRPLVDPASRTEGQMLTDRAKDGVSRIRAADPRFVFGFRLSCYSFARETQFVGGRGRVIWRRAGRDDHCRQQRGLENSASRRQGNGWGSGQACMKHWRTWPDTPVRSPRMSLADDESRSTAPRWSCRKESAPPGVRGDGHLADTLTGILASLPRANRSVDRSDQGAFLVRQSRAPGRPRNWWFVLLGLRHDLVGHPRAQFP